MYKEIKQNSLLCNQERCVINLKGRSSISGVLVDLLEALLELSPSSCHVDHVSVYFGAYGASLSNSGKTIKHCFKLLVYEQWLKVKRD